MGFVVLTRAGATRRIPYYFAVTRPALESMTAKTLATLEPGDTIRGENKVSQYRFPAWPFGPAPNYSGGQPANEPGAERLYSIVLTRQRVNFGVAVWEQSANSIIDPWVLGSPDENDVQGFAGTPVNVNGLMFDYRADIEAAGASFPVAKRYYVSVDSGADRFTDTSLPGRYVIKSWVDDLHAPVAKLLTTRVTRGRPTLAAKIIDKESGVDPLSVYIAYNNVLLGAAAYDFDSGVALFPIPENAPQVTRNSTPATIVGSDFQETKNVNTIGKDVMPNTVFKRVAIRAVSGPSLTWLLPESGSCVRGKTSQLLVTAHSTRAVRSVTFFDGKRRIGRDTSSIAGLFSVNWKLAKAKKGKHSLTAVSRDAAGRTLSVRRTVRVCK
jgi:hypothetical protein